MAGLSEIVKINISTQSAQVKQPGFGVVCIADAHTRFNERIRFYDSTAAMLDDGFTVNDPAYLAAQALMSQNPQAAKFAIGRRASLPSMKFELTPAVVNSKKYVVKINGAEKSFTSAGAATLSQITAGLVAAIGVVPGFTVTDTGPGTKITIAASAPGNWLRIEALDSTLIKVEQTHADAGIATDLAAIAMENPDFYGICLTTASKAEIVAAAAWTEANKRILVQSTQDSDVINAAAAGATDVAATLKTNNYARTATIYHPDNGAFADAAWFGKTFPKNPGSLTFKFKTLAGVAGVKLNGTQLTNAKDKNTNVFTDVGGVNITLEGKVAVGEYIDVIRDRDWFEARLQVRTFSVLANNDKVPFTDGGIGVVEAELRAQLREGIDSGFLTDDPAPIVIVPRANAIASVDKQARKLKGLKFSAVLAGAVHNLELDGSITV